MPPGTHAHERGLPQSVKFEYGRELCENFGPPGLHSLEGLAPHRRIEVEAFVRKLEASSAAFRRQPPSDDRVESAGGKPILQKSLVLDLKHFACLFAPLPHVEFESVPDNGADVARRPLTRMQGGSVSAFHTREGSCA